MTTKLETQSAHAALNDPLLSADANPEYRALLDPANKMEIYSYVRNNGMDNPVIWLMSGTVYLKRLGELIKPAFRYRTSSWNCMRPGTGDAHHRQRLDEVGFYADLETGKIIDKWRSPKTNSLVDVGHRRDFGGDGTPYSTKGEVIKPSYAAKSRGLVGQVEVFNQTLWMEEYYSVQFRLSENVSGGDEYLQIDPKSIFQADPKHLMEVLDGKKPFVPATTYFNYVTGPLPWMDVDGHIDYLLWNIKGIKVRGIEDVPRDIYERANVENPDFFTSPQIS